MEQEAPAQEAEAQEAQEAHAAPHTTPHAAPEAPEPKRRGRPPGSKNKPKQDVPTEPELELARKLWDWGSATGFRPQEKGRGVLLDCAWTRKPDCEEARLLAKLPEVLLPVRSVKC